MRQYKYRCCGHVVSIIDKDKLPEERCHFCGTVNPVLEEVDKEDQVFLNVGGYSGNVLFAFQIKAMGIQKRWLDNAEWHMMRHFKIKFI